MRDGTSYRVIAPYYDWIMAHVDYDAWGRYLVRLWRRLGAEPASVLELGAGTCPFARRRVFPPGARVVHSDLSPYMLARAADAEPVPLRAAANVLALPFKARFDLCLMIYDALNYVMTEADLLRSLREVRAVLADGGLFLFDVTTEANSRRHFEDVLDFGELAGCSYVRESRYDRGARLQRNDFTFFVEGGGGCWTRVKESHQQRIWSLGRIRALAREAGFEVEGCFEGFTFRPGREASERIHFALRKAAGKRAPAARRARAREAGAAA
jgi:SAM-dependent methyltransferase